MLSNDLFLTEPYPWQRDACERALKHSEFALLAEMGCVTGDTEIKVNRAGSSRVYKIRDLVSPKDPRWDTSIPNMVRSLNEETQTIQLNESLKVFYTGYKKVFEVTLMDGKKIKATGNHRIKTKNSWCQVKHLVPGKTLVAVDNQSRHQKKQTLKDFAKPRYNLRQVGINYKGGHLVKNNSGKTVRRRELHILVYEAYHNNMTLETYIASTKNDPDSLKVVDSSKYHIHHIDHNPKNNSIANLRKMKSKDHLREHGDSTHFGHGLVSYSKVNSIRDMGYDYVFDMTCNDPHNNYVANGIVIHNCGKTKVLIDILRLRYAQEKRILKTVIFSPIVTLPNWKNEFGIHSKVPERNVFVLNKSSKRMKDFKKAKIHNNIIVVNYESLGSSKFLEELFEFSPEIIVCDEMHILKNPKSKRAKSLIKLSDRAEFRYGLTGTPILNSPMDIFMQWRFLDKGEEFGKSFFKFRAEFFQDANAAWSHSQSHFPKWEPIPSKFPLLQEKIAKKSVRVLKKDCLDLPPLIKEIIPLEMDKTQAKAYKEMHESFITFVKDKEQDGKTKAVVAQLALTKALRLQQICSGFVVTDEDETIRLDKNVKLDWVEQYLPDMCKTSKVIIWTAFKEDILMLGELCDKLKIKFGTIEGGQNMELRQECIDDFNNMDSDTMVIIANRSAGGIGINLVSSDTSIVFSRNFKLGDELQSEARNHRGGSQIHKNILQINLCINETIDFYVTEALSNKQDISKKIIDLVREK